MFKKCRGRTVFGFLLNTVACRYFQGEGKYNTFGGIKSCLFSNDCEHHICHDYDILLRVLECSRIF